MKAIQTKLLEFLNGNKQLIIPIYQRPYSWTQEQCEQLWKDIVKTAVNEKIAGHFIGSIVYIEKDMYQVSSIPKLLVIDGQQRITTMSLILHALGQAMKESEKEGENSQKKINNYYLFNSEEEGEMRHKLLLTQSDKTTLLRLMEGKELVEPVSKRIQENYRYFQEQIRKCDVGLDVIFRGISKLIIVDISLDRTHDNPQLIFESLNSTGLELSQADLIRNFVLMGLEPDLQTELYNDYWFLMEQSFGQDNYSEKFDQFMRDYLTVKTGRIPNIREVYKAFKSYEAENHDLPIKELVADIFKYSKYFVAMALEKEEDKDLRNAFSDINTLRVEVAFPLLLEMYDDYESEKLNRNDFLLCIRLIESYVFRRAICGIPTNSLNKTFATFSKDLNKKEYVESFAAKLVLKDSYRRFPADSEFTRDLVMKDLYSFRRGNYWLRKLENDGRKERVDVESYTIEHIMPQNDNLSSEWREELGERWKEVQEEYLHTLGNLTLTGYNSEYSDAPFLKKRDMKNESGDSIGFAGSPLRMNEGLGVLEHWNEAEIKRRAERFAKLAVQVWTYPMLDNEILKKYKEMEQKRDETDYAIEDHPNLTGEVLQLFEQVRNHVRNLDPSVQEEIRKRVIAYKTTDDFVSIIPRKDSLRLVLNMKFSDIDDPKSLCKDITGGDHFGTGDVRVKMLTVDQMEDVLALIRQAYAKQAENGD